MPPFIPSMRRSGASIGAEKTPTVGSGAVHRLGIIVRIGVLTSALAVLATGLLRGCAGSAPVELMVANNAAEPMRCAIFFGHWVERDAGVIPPGGTLRVALRRQPDDGALYVARDDGRRMMVENLICGPLDGWWERRADVPLLPIRAGGERTFSAACGMEQGRAMCSGPTRTGE